MGLLVRTRPRLLVLDIELKVVWHAGCAANLAALLRRIQVLLEGRRQRSSRGPAASACWSRSHARTSSSGRAAGKARLQELEGVLVRQARRLVAREQVWVHLFIQLPQDSLQSGQLDLRAAALDGLPRAARQARQASSVTTDERCETGRPVHQGLSCSSLSVPAVADEPMRKGDATEPGDSMQKQASPTLIGCAFCYNSHNCLAAS